MDLEESNEYIKKEILKYNVNHWREYAHNSQIEWKKSIILDSKMNHLQLRKALKHWHEWSQDKYHNKNTIKYKNSMESIRIITMKRCIRFWHKFVERNYLSHKQYYKASAFYNIKQQQSCIADWRYLTQKKKNLNRKYQMIAKMNDNNSDQSFHIHIFNEWKTEYDHMQNQYVLAKHIYQKNLKRKILIAFKTNIKYQYEIQQKLDDVMFGEKQKERTNRNELQNAYLKWKHKTMEMKCIKKNIDNETRKNLLNIWRSNTLKQQRLRYIQNKINIKYNGRRKKKILNEWKLLLIENQQSQSYLLSNYINFWYCKSKKQHQLKLKYKILNEWICMRLINKLWLKWYLLTQDQIEINDKMEISINFHSNKCQSLLFIHWKQYISKSKKQKKMIKRIKKLNKMRLKKRIFKEWYVQYKMKEIQIRLMKSSLIEFWNNKTKEKKYRIFSQRKANLFCKNLYFTKWIKYYEPFKIGNEYENQLSLSIKPYINSSNKRLLFNGMKKWHKLYKLKVMEPELIKLRKHNIKKQAFCKWTNVLKKQNDLYAMNESIVLDIINDIFDAENKEIEKKNKIKCIINNIELSLKDLLYQKLNFRQNCDKFVKFGSNVGVDLKLDNEIKRYLMQKQERKEQIILILRDISSLYDLM